MRNIPTIINALVALAIVALLVQFGLRPAIAAVSQVPAPVALGSDESTAHAPMLPGSEPDEEISGDLARLRGPESKARMTPKDRLEKLVEIEEEQIVEVLKQWIRKGAAT